MFVLKTLIVICIFGCIGALADAVGFLEGSLGAQFILGAILFATAVAFTGMFLTMPTVRTK